ncbi:MAG: hypothetical protein RLZ92_1834 [Pseudomonadota bacterium]
MFLFVVQMTKLVVYLQWLFLIFSAFLLSKNAKKNAGSISKFSIDAALLKDCINCLDKVFRTGRLRSASKEGGMKFNNELYVTKEK